MIKILVADDHAIFREGLKRIIESASDLELVAEATTGQEAIDRARASRPDVVILDVSMPGRGGIETAGDLKHYLPRVRVLMLTVHPEDHFAIRCLKEGADGYMTKDVAPTQLVEAIRKIHGGGKYVSQSLAERLALSLETGLGQAPHEGLSDRELQVMTQIASGKTVSEIAAELSLSVKTVSTYRARVLQKMRLRNNAEIMRYVVDAGLLE